MGPVGVIGLGVVGGTLARALTEAGLEVRGYDLYLEKGTLADLAGCPVVFLCVPTPSTEERHDVSAVWSAVRDLEAHAEPGTVVAVKSTVPPGTVDELSKAFPRLEFASVPEFLVATRPMQTLTKPDRILVGAHSGAAAVLVADLMSRIAPTAPVIILQPAETELIKLCANAMLAAKVTMANELAEVCARFGVSWTRVQAGVGLDRRIGPEHLTVTPERGFGGECLPKDLRGLIAAARAEGYAPRVLEEILEFNTRVRREVDPSEASRVLEVEMLADGAGRESS